MSKRLRLHLAELLEKKVRSHGLVIWDDSTREFGAEVAASVVPASATFLAYDGSWFDLRHRVEGLVGGNAPPAMVIYVPAVAPPSDPLLELRAAGGQFAIRLRTLVQQALKGQMTESRLDEVGRRARTLAEAEAALDGDSSGDPRLVAALGTSDIRRMVIATLSGERDAQIADLGAWDDVGLLLARTVGSVVPGRGEEFRRATMRHLLLAELLDHLGELPQGVAPGWEPPNDTQRRSAAEVLKTWRGDREGIKTYVPLCLAADRELGLEGLEWTRSLNDLDSLPSIESAAIRESLRRLGARDYSGAAELARGRLEHSLWAGDASTIPGVPEWGSRWEVLAATADLRNVLSTERLPAGGASAILSWYAQSGWKVDRAHRHLETTSSTLGLEGELEGEIASARASYEDWLGRLLNQFTTAVAGDGLDAGDIALQSHIHKTWVADSKQATAYVWVDALRFELGRELADRLASRATSVELRPAIGTLPSITPVGMANLCPGAEAGLEINLKSGRLSIRIGGVEVKDVPTRIELVRSADGRVEDLSLSKLLAQGEKKLAETLAGSQVVVVRSQEIDAAGESGMLATSWQGFEDTVQQLERAAARLAQAGIQRLVITADHGFVALSRALGQDKRVDAPTGGNGELHARAWVGDGGIDSANTVRVPLSSAGVKSDLDLLCPTNLAVFRGSWPGQFFHGGISPQELVIPVIVVELPPPIEQDATKVEIAVAGDRLTSGIFSATISIPGQRKLFEDPMIRILVRKKGSAAAVARIFRGDGFDADADAVRPRGGMASLTFRLTANLAREDEVEIVVLDATTDRKLGSTTVRAAAPIVVEEDLG